MFGGFPNNDLVGVFVLKLPGGGGKIWMYLDLPVSQRNKDQFCICSKLCYTEA